MACSPLPDQLSPIEALVLGGSSGIGLAEAERLAARKLGVALVARDRTRLARSRNRLLRAGAPIVETRAVDLVDPQARATLLDDVIAQGWPLRQLFVGGPGPRPGRRDEVVPADHRNAVQVCLRYPLDVLCRAHALMPQGGEIVILSSSTVYEPAADHGFFLSARYRRLLDKLAQRCGDVLNGAGVSVRILRPRVVLTRTSLAFARALGARGPAEARRLLGERFDCHPVPMARDYLRSEARS